MEHRPHAGFLTRSGAPARPTSSSSARPPADAGVVKPSTASILIVEDQEDVRRMMVTALTIEGHQVDEAANGPEGLERLKQGRYQLVLSDYAMPGQTGSWMLREATRLGLLDHTAAVIITAHPDIEPVPGVVVIPKPLDLDDFLEQLRKLLDPVRDPECRSRAGGAGAPGRAGALRELGVECVPARAARGRTGARGVRRVSGAVLGSRPRSGAGRRSGRSHHVHADARAALSGAARVAARWHPRSAHRLGSPSRVRRRQPGNYEDVD